jgi:gliding motility-associated-like protein
MVQTTSLNSCVYMDSVTVLVYFDPPVPVIPDVVPLCQGSSVVITVSGAETYVWTPANAITPQTGPTVTVSPADDFTYYCDFINACGTVPDSVFVDVITASIIAGNDTIICPGESAGIWASGGVSYVWSPAATLSNAFTSITLATPTSPTYYVVIGTDANGCTDSDSVYVDLFPQPFIQTNPDVFAMYGDEVQLSATSTTSGTYFWSPAEYLSCVACNSPVASPNETSTYTVSYTDQNGCSAQDNVTIRFDPIIYIPNTFTPDGNEFNQTFSMVAANISKFELLIFDRWGELLYTISDANDYWDGTYQGNPCQDGTYTWKLTYWNESDEEFQRTGHVNLLR